MHYAIELFPRKARNVMNATVSIDQIAFEQHQFETHNTYTMYSEYGSEKQ